MPEVFLSVFDPKTRRITCDTLFTGNYEECVLFYNEELVRQKTKEGDELYIRTYPSSHNSIEAVWMRQRLALKNWKVDPEVADR